jgi:hypothetical protein
MSIFTREEIEQWESGDLLSFQADRKFEWQQAYIKEDNLSCSRRSRALHLANGEYLPYEYATVYLAFVRDYVSRRLKHLYHVYEYPIDGYIKGYSDHIVFDIDGWQVRLPESRDGFGKQNPELKRRNCTFEESKGLILTLGNIIKERQRV